MGPKNGKKDRNSTGTSNNGSQNQAMSKSHEHDRLQADHELFLQAFESKF